MSRWLVNYLKLSRTWQYRYKGVDRSNLELCVGRMMTNNRSCVLKCSCGDGVLWNFCLNRLSTVFLCIYFLTSTNSQFAAHFSTVKTFSPEISVIQGTVVSEHVHFSARSQSLDEALKKSYLYAVLVIIMVNASSRSSWAILGATPFKRRQY